MFNTSFLSPTDQKYADSSTYRQYFCYRPAGKFRYTAGEITKIWSLEFHILLYKLKWPFRWPICNTIANYRSHGCANVFVMPITAYKHHNSQCLVQFPALISLVFISSPPHRACLSVFDFSKACWLSEDRDLSMGIWFSASYHKTIMHTYINTNRDQWNENKIGIINSWNVAHASTAKFIPLLTQGTPGKSMHMWMFN